MAARTAARSEASSFLVENSAVCGSRPLTRVRFCWASRRLASSRSASVAGYAPLPQASRSSATDLPTLPPPSTRTFFIRDSSFASGILLDSDDHRVRADEVLDARGLEAGLIHPRGAVRAGVVEAGGGLDEHVEA